MNWSELSGWWLEEIETDPAYETVVTPLLLDVLRPEPDALYLDLGCGEGRVMRAVAVSGTRVHGLDLTHDLALRAGAAFVAELPDLPVRDGVYDGVYCVLTLEHVVDHRTLFAEAARVTKSGGVFALVANHPVWTAPDSTPITDEDGEVLWRPGTYFGDGSTEVPAGASSVTFHHRSMSELLNAAADAGRFLEHMAEQPHHEYDDQAGIPRLLGCRWRRG